MFKLDNCYAKLLYNLILPKLPPSFFGLILYLLILKNFKNEKVNFCNICNGGIYGGNKCLYR